MNALESKLNKVWSVIGMVLSSNQSALQRLDMLHTNPEKACYIAKC